MEKRVIRFYDPDGEYGYLSNWYISDFTYAGRTYHSVEQYMMFQKALTFGDLEIADKIMASTDLPEIKKLGRSVAHYNDVLWKTIRVQIMRRGIRAKFQQNPELLYNLLGTGSTLLAECAPRDLVWGIGLDIEDARSGEPKEWKGRNQLGRTLMRVREDLRSWCSVAGASVTQYVDAVDLRAPQPIRVSRRNDSDKAERIRRELEEAAGTSEAVNETSSENEDSSESTVWNMPIYEACMLPYLSEITATWMEEVFFNLRRSRSYEDLSVANYTFEELEWMFRSGQSAGLPIAGFFEMKQDIFDLMRYRGGLRNPASLLAQVESAADASSETIPAADTELPGEAASEGTAAQEQYEETHIIVDVARRDNRNRLVGTQDPGRTSSPDTYVVVSSSSPSGDVQEYVPEEGEEATTLFGAGFSEGMRAGDMWSVIRDMEDETQESDGEASSGKPEPKSADETVEEQAPEEIVVESVPYEIVTGTMPDEVVVELETEEEEPSYTVAEPAKVEPETLEYTVEAADGKAAEEAETVEETAAEEPAAATEFTPAAESEPAEETVTETASVAETEAVKEVATAEEIATVAKAEPVEEVATAEETAPAVEAEPVKEVATAEETTPVEETEPAKESAETEQPEQKAEPEKKPWYTEFVKPVVPEEPAKEAVDEAAETEEAAQTAAEETAEASSNGEFSETTENAEDAETEQEETEPDDEYDESDEDESEDEDEEFEESDDEDEDEEEDEDEDEEDEDADEEEEEDFPEPPAPKTQFIPRAEPVQQRPLTYRDEIRSEIVIKHGNIATVDCDCVVNATNTTLMGGNGIDNSIMKAAGPELLRECAALKGCDVGRAKISGGYRLKAQFVIHTVGPRYSGDETDPVYLTMCYENCLNLAMKYDIHSIAFPPISTGYYGYPLREATRVASRTVQGWMRRHPEYGIKVIFVSADDRTFAMYKDVFK